MFTGLTTGSAKNNFGIQLKAGELCLFYGGYLMLFKNKVYCHQSTYIDDLKH
jgi:hypothetical protein